MIRWWLSAAFCTVNEMPIVTTIFTKTVIYDGIKRQTSTKYLKKNPYANGKWANTELQFNAKLAIQYMPLTILLAEQYMSLTIQINEN